MKRQKAKANAPSLQKSPLFVKYVILLIVIIFALSLFVLGKNYATGQVVLNYSKTGYVYISTTPTSAGVYVDNTYRGTTPVRVSELRYGSHKISVIKSGYSSVNFYAQVYPELTTAISNLALAPVSNTSSIYGYDASSNQTPLACTDTDGGQNYNLKGTATFNGTGYPDFCYSSTGVYEYYCNNATGWITTATYVCPVACLKGACTTNTTACADTDGGTNVIVFGRAVNRTHVREDSCADTSRVNEYYCSGSTIAKMSLACPSGTYCEDGRCISTRIFLDGIETTGNATIIYIRNGGSVNIHTSSISVYVNNVTRYCAWDNSSIFVTPVGGLLPVSAVGSCNISSNVCSHGEEIKVVGPSNNYTYGCPGQNQTTCTDSDGGNNVYTKGTCTNSNGSYTDYCVYPGIREYYCTGSTCASTTSSCPSSYGCVNGVCVLNTTNTCENSTIIILDGGEIKTVCTDRQYNISLIRISSATTAVIKIGNEQVNITKGNRYTIGGLSFYVVEVYWFSTTNQTQNQIKIKIGNPDVTVPCNTTSTQYLTGLTPFDVKVCDKEYWVVLNSVTSATTATLTVGNDTQSVTKGNRYTIGGLKLNVTEVYWFSTTNQTQNQIKIKMNE